MSETVALAASLVAIAVIAFGLSIRFGMLLGRRLDRALEERDQTSDELADSTAPIPDAKLGYDKQGGIAGQEEIRGE